MVDWQWHPLASAKGDHLPLADDVELVPPRPRTGVPLARPYGVGVGMLFVWVSWTGITENPVVHVRSSATA